MLVVFEGIDGSGKTTLSGTVAARLREAGLSVEHVREGGRFASAVTNGIREFTRDTGNLFLEPDAELLLYLARESQLLREQTLPALGRADVVIADRYAYTAEVLATAGRGLEPSRVRPYVDAACASRLPDLVFLVDVEPHVARARRKVSKLVAGPSGKPPSRKGLAGAGLQHRLRDGYRARAAREPERWIVVDNTDADLDRLVEDLTALIRLAKRQGAHAAIRASAALPGPSAPATVDDPDSALAALLQWVDARAGREPALAAWFLGGLAGPEVDARRVALAETAPAAIAAGLRGMDDEASWELRERLLEAEPALVARSLVGAAGEGERGWRWREMLADRHPVEIAATVDGRPEPRAWALRTRIAAGATSGDAFDRVVSSTRRLDGPNARWFRDEWRARNGLDRGNVGVLCGALTGVDSPRAWSWRDEAYAIEPVAALRSIAGLDGARAWEWRERHLRHAPKTVMESLEGMDDPRAWAMREAVADRCKEAVDGMPVLAGGEAAWRLRAACVERWPSTVVKTLGELAETPRGRALVAAALARPGNPSLWKHAGAIALGARARAGAPDAGRDAGSAAAGRFEG